MVSEVVSEVHWGGPDRLDNSEGSLSAEKSRSRLSQDFSIGRSIGDYRLSQGTVENCECYGEYVVASVASIAFGNPCVNDR